MRHKLAKYFTIIAYVICLHVAYEFWLLDMTLFDVIPCLRGIC